VQAEATQSTLETMELRVPAAVILAHFVLVAAGCVGAIGSAEPRPQTEPIAPDAEAQPEDVRVPVAAGPGAPVRVGEDPIFETPPSTTPRGCPAGIAFCDDFDGGAVDSDVWETVTREGSEVAVVDGALRLSLSAADGARALVRPQGLVSVLGDRFWGRFFMRTDPGVDMVHSYLMNAEGTLDGARAYYGLHSNQGRLNSRYVAAHVEEHGGWKKIGEHTLPGEWTCIEFHFDLERGAMSFFFEGEEDLVMRVDETDSPPWTGPELSRIDFGFHTYQAAERPFEVFYDGIAFDTNRVGCD